MNTRSLFVAAVLAAAPASLLAQDAPRQLSTAPSVPDSVRTAAPAQAPIDVAPPRNHYRIGLKSGQVYAASDVEVRQPVLGRSFLLVNGQQRFELDQIKFFEDETGHYIRTTLPGARRESTLRREKIGRISTYSITTQQFSPNNFGPYGYGTGFGRYYNPYGFGNPYGGYRTVKTEYFSKEGGPVQEMSFRNLSVALADNPGSAELLRDVAKLRRVSTAGYLVGGGLMAVGLLSTFNGSSQRISPLMFVSVPVLLVPTIVSGSQARKLRQAVALYNSR